LAPERVPYYEILGSLVVACLLAISAQAQTLTVQEVWILPSESVSRPAMEADSIELSLATGRWQRPSEATPFERAAANDDGWIRSESLLHGYAFAKISVEERGIWLLDAMGYEGVYVNGAPRIGNIYGYKDAWESWEPRFDYSVLPVLLEEDENHLLFYGNRYGVMRARLQPAQRELSFNAKDWTFPDLVVGEPADSWAALVVLNATEEIVTDAALELRLEGALPLEVNLPPLPPYGARKVGFPVQGPAVDRPGPRALQLGLRRAGRLMEEIELSLEVKPPEANRRVTFLSQIDGSVQYFGYLPASGGPGAKALFLSLHGAAVEAINQSGSYPPRTWGHLLAPTNRRPFGFSWEDWGRLDALEVLQLGLDELDIDRDRIYLTGHSMGGHGTWHVGSLHPDRFAAIGPSAGWISVWSYREEPRGVAPTPLTALVERATLPSETLEWAPNLDGLGIYVLHGSEDDNVPPEQSHLMLEQLETFHHDYVYHEEPGVGHWWDLSDAPGADCVSWVPMFDFFAQHRRPRIDEVQHVRFRSPSPALSACNNWAGIHAQQRPFLMSRIDLHHDPLAATLQGQTENVEILALDFSHQKLDSLHVQLDGDMLHVTVPTDGRLWLGRDMEWKMISRPSPAHKGPHRGGSFREAFAHKTQLVYATGGTSEENAWALAKARYDAEILWYRGNASVDVLPDTLFAPDAEPERCVVLYGNADTHAHWEALWKGPVQVRRDELRLSERELRGDGLGILAVYPRPGSERACVGIVAATGLPGARLMNRRPYLSLGVSYPDLTVFAVADSAVIVRGAGFFGNDWSVERGEFVWRDEDGGGR
jgi:pimeloyl-ACP methyl ester carboxylesterase